MAGGHAIATTVLVALAVVGVLVGVALAFRKRTPKHGDVASLQSPPTSAPTSTSLVKPFDSGDPSKNGDHPANIPKASGDTAVVRLTNLDLWREVPLSRSSPALHVKGPLFPLGKPPLITFESVLTDAECGYLAARVEAAHPGHSKASPSFCTTLVGKESTHWVTALEARFGTILQTHPGKLETMSVLTFRQGHSTGPHRLTILGDNEAAAHPAGQRTSTLVVFLSALHDLEDGGRLEFPDLNTAIRPQQGSVVAWNTRRPPECSQASPQPDTTVKHAVGAMYLKRSVQHVLVVHARERAFEE